MLIIPSSWAVEPFLDSTNVTGYLLRAGTGDRNGKNTVPGLLVVITEGDRYITC